MKKLILISISLFLFVSHIHGDSKDDFKKQQNSLKEINADIDKSEKKLEKLLKKENSVQKELANSKQKINANNKVITGLNKELRQIQKSIKDSQLELDGRTQTLEQSKRRYLGNIRQFYLTAHRTDRKVFSEDPNEEMHLSRHTCLILH